MGKTKKRNIEDFRDNMDVLHSLFSYDPESGNLIRRTQANNFKAKIGDIAGTMMPLGHIVVKVIGRRYLAHHLIWAMVYGEIPEMDIDHIDGCGSNNRIENLRVATSSQNSFNASIPEHNTSGHKGISWDKARQKWEVYIQVGYKKIHLGRFTEWADAVSARKEAEEKYHGAFSRKNVTRIPSGDEGLRHILSGRISGQSHRRREIKTREQISDSN